MGDDIERPPHALSYASALPRKVPFSILAIGLVILALLLAVGFYCLTLPIRNAKRHTASSETSTMAAALELYKADTGSYPTTAQGLAALRSQPPGVAGWIGPYLDHPIVADPWGHAYIYRCPGTLDPGGFDLLSMGPDGLIGGGDDILFDQPP